MIIINRFILFAAAFSLAFSVLLAGTRTAEAVDPKPVPRSLKVPPLKDDIDAMMQQRAVQQLSPAHSELEQGASETPTNGGEEGGEEATKITDQEPADQD